MRDGEFWAWPGNARKTHVFKDGRSLCGRWMFFGGKDDHDQTMKEEPGKYDCVVCWRKAQS